MSSKTAGSVVSDSVGVSDGSCEGVELVRGVGVELVSRVGVLREGVGKGFVGSEDVALSLVGSIVVNIGSVPKNTGSDSGPIPAAVRAVTVTQ